MSYVIKAKSLKGEGVGFEGPLDVLLELIEKNKLDITDISLAEVTDQFIDYMQNNGDTINPSYLSEFILVAGKLLLIKSKAILPLLEIEKEEEEDIEELKKKLREYKRFKEVFPKIKNIFESKQMFFSRSGYSGVREFFCPPKKIGPEELHSNFISALSKVPEKDSVEETKKFNKISISDKMKQIYDSLLTRIETTFSGVIKESENRMEVVVLFLATLELARKNKAVINQDEMFGEITIKKV